MKFDKAMEIAYKILAVCTCLALVFGVVSCSKYYINASAVEITAEEQAGIDEFLSAYSDRQAAIDWQWSSDADGNRSTRLKIFGMQQLFFSDATSVYDNMDFSVAPDTLTFSGGGVSALYKDSAGNVKTALLHVTDYTSSFGTHYLVTAPDFSIYFESTGERSSQYRFYNSNTSSSYKYYSFQFGAIYQGQLTNAINPNLNLAPLSSTYSAPVSIGATFMVDVNRIPELYGFNSFTGNQVVGGLGQDIALPSGTVDTEKPWKYYNDVFLPYVHNEFGDQYNDYLVFPDGYTPHQDPTEPPGQEPGKPGAGVPVIVPIIIGSGNIINVDGIDFDVFAPIKGQLEIDGITFQFPIDGMDDVYIDRTPFKIPLPEFEYKGHNIEIPDLTKLIFDGVTFNINPDGSISINNQNYPLPIGQPDTVSSDAYELVYKYEIPTIERLNIPDATLSPIDLSAFADSITFVSRASMDTLEQLGLTPFVVAMLLLGVIGYGIWKLGG